MRKGTPLYVVDIERVLCFGVSDSPKIQRRPLFPLHSRLKIGKPLGLIIQNLDFVPDPESEIGLGIIRVSRVKNNPNEGRVVFLLYPRAFGYDEFLEKRACVGAVLRMFLEILITFNICVQICPIFLPLYNNRVLQKLILHFCFFGQTIVFQIAYNPQMKILEVCHVLFHELSMFVLEK